MGPDLGKLLLRLSVGGLMLLHGFHKVRHGIGGILGDVTAHGLPSFLGYGVYVGEVLAPILVLIGFMTRPAALAIAVNMVVAVYLAHMGSIFALTKNGAWAIELNGLYFLGALAIALLGTGRYAVMNGAGRWS